MGIEECPPARLCHAQAKHCYSLAGWCFMGQQAAQHLLGLIMMLTEVSSVNSCKPASMPRHVTTLLSTFSMLLHNGVSIPATLCSEHLIDTIANERS